MQTNLDQTAPLSLRAVAKQIWSNAIGIASPIFAPRFGMFSFLTCGAAVVITATVVALQIR